MTKFLPLTVGFKDIERVVREACAVRPSSRLMACQLTRMRHKGLRGHCCLFQTDACDFDLQMGLDRTHDLTTLYVYLNACTKLFVLSIVDDVMRCLRLAPPFASVSHTGDALVRVAISVESNARASRQARVRVRLRDTNDKIAGEVEHTLSLAAHGTANTRARFA